MVPIDGGRADLSEAFAVAQGRKLTARIRMAPQPGQGGAA